MKYLKLLLHVTLIFFVSCNKSINENVPVPGSPSPSTTNLLGRNWSLKNIPVTALYDIYFANNTTGFAAGAGSIFKSVDGGNTWSAVYNNSTIDFINLSVTPSGNVFAISRSSNTIYKSVNNGQFVAQSVQSFEGSADVFFSGNDTGFVSMASSAQSRGLIKTVNGGTDWSFIPITGYNIDQSSYLSFTSSTSGYVTGSGLFYTKNINWLPAAIQKDVYMSVDAVDSKTAYASGASGTVYKTTDGGTSFIVSGVLPDAVAGFLDIDFTDEQTGYICNGKKIYKTIDGGKDWTTEVTLADDTINEIHFTDGGHGWACGSNGVVLIYKA